MGRSLHNTCNELRIDYRQKRRSRTVQSDRRMLHHSISTQSGMAVFFQFRAISHLIVDDHWNGCLLNCLRGSHSRNNSICFTIDVAIHRLGFLCRPHQHGIPVEFDEMNETFNINESSFSFDSSMQTEKSNKGPNQMMSIRTGLGVMFSPSVVVFCWDLNNTVQSTTHTTSGTKRGNKVVSDCCMKIATTPISPKMNPSPLRTGNEAPSSVFRFSIN